MLEGIKRIILKKKQYPFQSVAKADLIEPENRIVSRFPSASSFDSIAIL